jgi:sterol desaturase/sphingolipid hydroxylase (fatty acid hydroxylase superfamily)
MDILRNFAIETLRISLWLVVLTVIFGVSERLWALHPQKLFRRDVWADVGYFFINSLLLSLLLVPPMAVLAWCLHAMVPDALRGLTVGLPLALRLALALMVGEIGCYWAHRWMHEVPFLWRFHSLHHNSEQIDWLVNTRAHPLDLVFNRLCGFIPMYVVGLAQPIHNMADRVSLGVVLVGTVWGFFIHANVRWRFGPIEWLFATPVFHHWHHTNDEHFNHNYSTMLPWMDMIFGTYYMPRKQWPPCYGINEKLPDSVGEQLLYPLLPHHAPAAAEKPGEA